MSQYQSANSVPGVVSDLPYNEKQRESIYSKKKKESINAKDHQIDHISPYVKKNLKQIEPRGKEHR